jgi:hypothetical protein
MTGAVDLGRLVELARHGVEVALEEPHVGAHGATEVGDDQARLRVETDRRQRLADEVERQVHRDEGEHHREHLRQQQGHEAGATTVEPHPGERVGGRSPDEDGTSRA